MIWVVSIVALLANLALNFAWDPKWGMYGAAWATTVAYALEGLLMYLYAQRVYPLPVNGRKLIVVIGIFCALLACTQLRLEPPGAALYTVATLIVGLLLLWLVGRKDLTLLKSLLHPSSSN